MTKQTEAMKRWVEVFDGNWHDEPVDTEWADRAHQALAEMRQAIAEAEAEQPAQQSAERGKPIAWMCSNDRLVSAGFDRFSACKSGDWNIPVYTTPQPPAQPLTDEQIDALPLPPSGTATVRDLIRIIEAAHGITSGSATTKGNT